MENLRVLYQLAVGGTGDGEPTGFQARLEDSHGACRDDVLG